MGTTIIVLLTALLIVQPIEAQQPAANDAMRQNIAALPPNAHVALHLSDGNTLRGRISRRADQDFVLKPDGGSAPQTIAYAQVQAVEQLKAHHSAKKTWIIVGVVVIVTLGIIVGVVATHLRY